VTDRAERRKPATARDVALVAEVSTATVSLVVNGKAGGRVTSATQERVWAAVRELDYRVHAAASRLATGNPGTVVFVSPDPTNPFFSLLLDGLLDGLDERLTLTLAAPRGGDDYDTQTVRRAQSADIAGLVLASPGDELVRELRSGRPTVLIDAGVRVDGMSGIDIDVGEGARLLADHLLALGHRRFAFVGVDRDKRTLRRRRERLGLHLQQQGGRFVVPDLAVPRMTMDASYRATVAAIDGWIAAGVTAVVAADDLLAFGALRAARQRGVDVPGTLSIAGFNDMPYAGMVTPSLTSVDLRARELGRATAVLLTELLADGTPSWAELEPRLAVRESTGPAR
jgi:DNA-binding LacI/PurR family transcriptional regulator